MFIQVNYNSRGELLSLEDGDNFQQFHICAPQDLDIKSIEKLLELDNLGYLSEDEQEVYIGIQGLVALAGELATPKWIEELEKMVAYAKSKGWTNLSGDSVKAHIEWISSDRE
jgi:hypothetical protein